MRFVFEAGRINTFVGWKVSFGAGVQFHPRYGELDRNGDHVVGRFLEGYLHLGWWYVYFGPMWDCYIEWESNRNR